MYKFNSFFLVLILAMAPGSIVAQTDFFWSFNNLNEGAVNANASAEFAPGANGTAYLYFTTNGPADSNLDVGAFLDIATSQSGVIQFTAAETLDFDINLIFAAVGPRWGDLAGATGTVTDDFIDELSAFTLFSGMGILESNNGLSGLLDVGYDAAADAFLFAKVDFTVAADPGPAGTTVDIVTSPGFGDIVNAGVSVPATFGNLQIVVAEETFVLGDFTGDGAVTMADVSPFVQAIISGVYQEVGDINGDGTVDLLDIRPFVQLLP